MSERWSAKGQRFYPYRSGSPPPLEYFAAERAPYGDLRLDVSFDGLRFVLAGLDAALSEALRARFSAFVAAEAPAGASDMTLDVRREDVEYFIEPPAAAEFNPVWIASEGTTLRYAAHTLAGILDTASRSATILLSRGDYEPHARAMDNVLRCAVAWCAAARGGALVHAAGGVRNGRGYLFFGESGAGKSTLASFDTRARFTSDDLSLVLPGPSGGLDLVGSPFSGSASPLRGRFPLAAGFRLVQADVAAVVPASRTIVLGQLVSNLPFLVDTLGARPDLFARIEESFSRVPLHQLQFRKDDSFWDAIDRAGL